MSNVLCDRDFIYTRWCRIYLPSPYFIWWPIIWKIILLWIFSPGLFFGNHILIDNVSEVCFFLTGTNVDTHHRLCKWRFFLHDQTHNFLVYDKTSRFSDLVVQFGFDLFIIMATRVVFLHKIMIEDTGLFVMLHNRYF